MGVERAPEGLSGSVGRWQPEGDFLGLTRVLSVWQRSDRHQGGWLPSATNYKQWGVTHSLPTWKGWFSFKLTLRESLSHGVN